MKKKNSGIFGTGLLLALLFEGIIFGITGLFKGGSWLITNNPELYYAIQFALNRIGITIIIITLAFYVATIIKN